ncbi:hypothetical protein [Methylobacterium persicinum]|uniref:Uncharacterized protein n=1 Tax=Methylobacterium persicinum TaxID=374426 RepID=A0ABU0HSY7_9HYPH|nr:hypothetical protein [Methylobacterium persicinum]MDQ0445449.1 hypothetical protein [Methylobacterium persicinum]
MASDERLGELEGRTSAIEVEIKRLQNSLALASEQIRSLQVGRTGDAHMAVIALGVLALVSLIEAAAIGLLWLR